MVFLVGPTWLFMIAYGFSPLKCTKSFELKGYKDDLVFFILLKFVIFWFWCWCSFLHVVNLPPFHFPNRLCSKDCGAETVLHWTERRSWQTFKVSDAGKGLERITHKGVVVVFHSESCRVCSCKPRSLEKNNILSISFSIFQRSICLT